MANVKLLLEVADIIEKSKTFDMSTVYNFCGTPACIAGHVDAMLGNSGAAFDGNWMPAMGRAAEALGLTKIEANELFMPTHRDVADCGARWSEDETGYITKEHAVRCLRLFAETGEIDWFTSFQGG